MRVSTRIGYNRLSDVLARGFSQVSVPAEGTCLLIASPSSMNSSEKVSSHRGSPGKVVLDRWSGFLVSDGEERNEIDDQFSFPLPEILLIAFARSTPEWIVRKGAETPSAQLVGTSEPTSKKGEMHVSECSPGGKWCWRKKECRISHVHAAIAWQRCFGASIFKYFGGCHMPCASEGTGTDCGWSSLELDFRKQTRTGCKELTMHTLAFPPPCDGHHLRR